ncbi:MAG: hypothetical protein MJ120_01220 [Clostridia bacterium]|nr:hypothetical protein [Clostridia bacterium]
MKCEKCEKEFAIINYNDRKVIDKVKCCPFCEYKFPEPVPPTPPQKINIFGVLFVIAVAYFAIIGFLYKFSF